MNSLIEIQKQIDVLQKQADDIRAQEFDKTVQDILAKMTAFGITLKDLESINVALVEQQRAANPQRRSFVDPMVKRGAVGV